MRLLNAVIITLMFMFTHSTLAAPDLNKTEMEATMRGIIVKLDKEEGVGTLRDNRKNRLVPFRFAKEFKDKNIHLLKVGHVVELTYIQNDGDIAALD